MRYEILHTRIGPVALISGLSAPLASEGDFLDAAAGAPERTIVLSQGDLAPEFFKLRSGLAGTILQKASNYRLRLLILGDFSAVSSKSLRDFIYESNRTGQVVFAKDLEEGLGLLR